MNLKNKLLLITTLLFVCACASNTRQETTGSKTNTSKKSGTKTLIVKGDTVYNYGAQNLNKSQVVTILNKDTYSNIIILGSEKVPHPIFGTQYKKFKTVAGILYFNITYDNGGGAMDGTPRLAAKVNAGKTYEFKSDLLSNFIEFYLVDVKTKKKNRVHFIREDYK